MKLERNRNLRKIVLAMAVAGYCAIPAIASAAWTSVTENTGNINGTVPWIQDTSTTPVDHHVSISAKRDGKKSTEQLAVGDEVTVLWVLADAEGDTDANNELTKATIKWLRNGQEISGVTGETYTLTSSDAGKNIGIKITPTTATGIPVVGAELTLMDITNGPGEDDGSDGSGSGDGGGSASDDIPAGPVIDNKVKVIIYKTNDTNQKNLLGTTDVLATNTSYSVILYSDADNDNKVDAGEDVTSQYDYRWRFTGTSTHNTEGGVVKDTWNNTALVTPATNTAAGTAFNSTSLNLGTDGVQGYGLSIDYQIIMTNATSLGEWYYQHTLLN
ncbi:hypothetical protein KER59_10215 [Escherichia coli]|nr:hypothetical protein [Escherichia coli]